MTQDSPSPPEPVDNLQFDQVESTAPASTTLTCAGCHNEIKVSYYEINGVLLCSTCRDAVQASLTGGSGAWRFLRATLFGIGAAAVGTLIYFGVRVATGYEIGLISIVVGLLVGSAVHKGSDGRGGWLYQGLAMYLTYASIVATYVPLVIQAARDRPAAAAQLEPGKDQPADNAKDALEKSSKVSLVVRLVLVLFVVFLFAHAIPVLMGPQNLMGWIIIGIGLYEAWKMNPRPATITGPYQLSAGAGPAFVEGGNTDDAPQQPA